MTNFIFMSFTQIYIAINLIHYLVKFLQAEFCSKPKIKISNLYIIINHQNQPHTNILIIHTSISIPKFIFYIAK